MGAPTDVLLRMIDDPALVPDVSPAEAMGVVVQLGALQTRLAAAVAASRAIDDGPVLYGMHEVADRLQLDLSHVYKLAKKGELVTVKQGRSVRVTRADLERYIAQRRAGGSIVR